MPLDLYALVIIKLSGTSIVAFSLCITTFFLRFYPTALPFILISFGDLNYSAGAIVNQPAVLRVSVSKAKNVNWNGNQVATGIFKLPVEEKVKVSRLNLDGDEQADLTVHGGPDKAVYAYPIEQYEYWKTELPDRTLEWGSFGENLTVSGFDENSICIGDKLQIGTAQFVVTQPRMPCFKLGIRLADPSMVRRFFKSGKWGFYLGVAQEGEIVRGDHITHMGGDGSNVTLAQVAQCFLDPQIDKSLLAKVLNSNLAEQMKGQLEYQRSQNR